MALTIQTANGPMTLTYDGPARRSTRRAPVASPVLPASVVPVAQPTWTGLETDQVQAGLSGERLLAVDGATNLAMVIWRPTEQMYCWRVQGNPVVHWSVTMGAAKASICRALGLPGGEHFGW